jgi:hypothetical protein
VLPPWSFRIGVLAAKGGPCALLCSSVVLAAVSGQHIWRAWRLTMIDLQVPRAEPAQHALHRGATDPLLVPAVCE